jgi:hypothetical protein
LPNLRLTELENVAEFAIDEWVNRIERLTIAGLSNEFGNSVAVIQLCRSKLPCDVLLLRILTQLQDAATSVASNYHAACRAQSRRSS